MARIQCKLIAFYPQVAMMDVNRLFGEGLSLLNRDVPEDEAQAVAVFRRMFAVQFSLRCVDLGYAEDVLDALEGKEGQAAEMLKVDLEQLFRALQNIEESNKIKH